MFRSTSSFLTTSCTRAALVSSACVEGGSLPSLSLSPGETACPLHLDHEHLESDSTNKRSFAFISTGQIFGFSPLARNDQKYHAKAFGQATERAKSEFPRSLKKDVGAHPIIIMLSFWLSSPPLSKQAEIYSLFSFHVLILILPLVLTR